MGLEPIVSTPPAMALGEEPGLRAATGSGRWRVLPVALPQPRSVALSFFDFQAKHLILLVVCKDSNLGPAD